MLFLLTLGPHSEKQNVVKRRLAPLAVAITAALVTQSVRADHILVLTETSSTTLTATYDGSAVGVTVINISLDHWGVTVGFPVTFSGNPQWTEPDDSSFANVITTFGNNQLIINSDFFLNNTQPLADESTLTSFGTDTRDGAPISVTFDDDGDVTATVPDTGSTFVLLLLALAALFGAGRVRSPRLA
jgi:hypothetical protein